MKKLLVIVVLSLLFSNVAYSGTYAVKIKEFGIADKTVKVKTYGIADKDICIKNPNDAPNWLLEMLN